MTDSHTAPSALMVSPSEHDLDPYYEGLARGELMMPRCVNCRDVSFPPRSICSVCGEIERPEWITASGRGTVWTYCIYRKQYLEAFPAPYNVAVIELEEGARLVSSVRIDDLEALEVDMAVEAVFETTADGTVLYFAPAQVRTDGADSR